MGRHDERLDRSFQSARARIESLRATGRDWRAHRDLRGAAGNHDRGRCSAKTRRQAFCVGLHRRVRAQLSVLDCR